MSLIFNLNFVHIIISDRVLFDFNIIHKQAFSELLAHAHSSLFNLPPYDKSNIKVETGNDKLNPPELLIIGIDEDDAESMVVSLHGFPYDSFNIHYWPFSVTGTKETILSNLNSYINIFKLKHQITNNKPTDEVQSTLGSIFKGMHVTIDTRYSHDDVFDYEQYQHDWQQDLEEKRFVLSLFNKYKELTIMPNFELNPFAHNFLLKQDHGELNFEAQGRYQTLFTRNMLLKTTQYLLNESTEFISDCFEKISEIRRYYSEVTERKSSEPYCLSSIRNLAYIDVFQQKIISYYWQDTKKVMGIRGRITNSAPTSQIEEQYIFASDGDNRYYIITNTTDKNFNVFINDEKLDLPLLPKDVPEELSEYKQCYEFIYETSLEIQHEFRMQTDNQVDLMITLQGG
jgi:hypothetical protein